MWACVCSICICVAVVFVYVCSIGVWLYYLYVCGLYLCYLEGWRKAFGWCCKTSWYCRTQNACVSLGNRCQQILHKRRTGHVQLSRRRCLLTIYAWRKTLIVVATKSSIGLQFDSEKTSTIRNFSGVNAFPNRSCSLSLSVIKRGRPKRPAQHLQSSGKMSPRPIENIPTLQRIDIGNGQLWCAVICYDIVHHLFVRHCVNVSVFSISARILNRSLLSTCHLWYILRRSLARRSIGTYQLL